jgi:hypothetical protein
MENRDGGKADRKWSVVVAAGALFLVMAGCGRSGPSPAVPGASSSPGFSSCQPGEPGRPGEPGEPGYAEPGQPGPGGQPGYAEPGQPGQPGEPGQAGSCIGG